MFTSSDLANLDLVLDAFKLPRTGDPSEVSGGTLNDNYHVTTADGPFFARRYRTGIEADRIRHEHSITRWVADRHAPAIAPLARPTGETVVEVEGRLWSLFPWVDGRAPVRGEIRPLEAEAIGEAHGHVQHLLADHPESEGASLKLLSERVAWDTSASLESLAAIEDRATEVGATQSLLDALAFQHQLLESEPSRSFEEFDWLPTQLLHGDFHDQQVLRGAGDTVGGVVDWELTQPASRVWELIRSLHFARLLETDLLERYLVGYRRHVKLTEDECRAGIEFWWQNTLHGTWVYRAYFLEGNERVTAFFPETDRHLRSFADPRQRTQVADRLVAVLA